MYKNLMWRMIVGIFFALPMGLLATTIVQANTSLQTAEPQDCLDCHESIQTSWAVSPHGQAFSDPIFQEAWQEQGKPQACLPCHTTGFDEATGTYEEEGVACTTCHYPTSVNHPDMVIMPTDISSRRCGDCHIDTYSDWQASTHLNALLPLHTIRAVQFVRTDTMIIEAPMSHVLLVDSSVPVAERGDLMFLVSIGTFLANVDREVANVAPVIHQLALTWRDQVANAWNDADDHGSVVSFIGDWIYRAIRDDAVSRA